MTPPPPASPEPGYPPPPDRPGFADATAPPTWPPVDPALAPTYQVPVANPYGAPAAGMPYPPQPPPPVRPPVGTNGFAIASLVLSICGGWVLGLVFGIIALSQTKRSGQKGRGMAIAGVAISAAWALAVVVGIAVAVIAGIGTGAGRTGAGAGGVSATNEASGSGLVLLDDVKPGDCVDALQQGLATRLPVVPCSQPHHAEVYATFSLAGSSDYPGDDAVSGDAGSGCGSRLEGYSPSAAADDTISVFYLKPTRQTWGRGDRRVICLAVDEEHTRTGSIKG